jgi:hypothetical protein
MLAVAAEQDLMLEVKVQVVQAVAVMEIKVLMDQQVLLI